MSHFCQNSCKLCYTVTPWTTKLLWLLIYIHQGYKCANMLGVKLNHITRTIMIYLVSWVVLSWLSLHFKHFNTLCCFTFVGTYSFNPTLHSHPFSQGDDTILKWCVFISCTTHDSFLPLILDISNLPYSFNTALIIHSPGIWDTSQKTCVHYPDLELNIP